jgi:capsular exopolysaccharide synthesis family protein
LRSRPQLAFAYEALLSSLEVRKREHRLKRLLVTSAQPGEGKSTVSVNLALTMYLAGRRVLLIDGDLRRPTIHHALGLANEVGFADLLIGKASVEEVVQSAVFEADAAAGEGVLGVIPSGRAGRNVIHALTSTALSVALAVVDADYDFVVIDSPPLLSVNDATLLSPNVDGALLVVGTGDAKVAEVRLAKERLEAAGGWVAGVVLNRFRDPLHGDAYNPYQSHYEPGPT